MLERPHVHPILPERKQLDRGEAEHGLDDEPHGWREFRDAVPNLPNRAGGT